jgi:cyclic pyranopterin phosphate synthase
MTPRLTDLLGRPLKSLRLSVTDRCNLRCRYCMPEDDYVWLPKASILSYEEMARLVRVFVDLGVDKVRLTGGEPLLRHDLHVLAGLLAAIPGLRDLALTTNGLLLARQAKALRAAGLQRVTVSLDTLRPDRFQSFAKSDRLADVLAGIGVARAEGFAPIKLNAVVVRGFNDDEIVDLLTFARREGAELRFIEYMDVGGATQWSPQSVVPRSEILARVAAAFGEVTPRRPVDRAAPAAQYELPDGTSFGVIASTTAPFCRGCDRGRLTADGLFYGCLYAPQGLELREPLRRGVTDAELAELVTGVWRARADRGAEERLRVAGRSALFQITELRADPHREMHTRGG